MTGLCGNCGAPLRLVHVRTETLFCPGGTCRKAGRARARQEAKDAQRGRPKPDDYRKMKVESTYATTAEPALAALTWEELDAAIGRLGKRPAPVRLPVTRSEFEGLSLLATGRPGATLESLGLEVFVCDDLPEGTELEVRRAIAAAIAEGRLAAAGRPCRGIEIEPGSFSGCSWGDGTATAATPKDCPTCEGRGVE